MKTLITSEKCYVQDTCKKFKLGKCTDPFCVRLYKINDLYDKSLLSNEQRLGIKLKLDVDGSDEVPYTMLQKYQQNMMDFVSTGSNLYIFSANTGNGKTSWAIKLLQAYILKIWHSSDLKCRALFINVPKYTRELKLNIEKRSQYIQTINESVYDADVVVWDDIATKSTSEYEHEQLISILDSRFDEKKCNIFTSNVSPTELQNYLGARLTSRIIGLSNCIQFNGIDKRGVRYDSRTIS